MLQRKQLRLGAALLLAAASLTLLAGCGWRGQTDPECGKNQTYIVIVNAKGSGPFESNRVSDELDTLLGEDWEQSARPVIIICQ